MSMNAAAPLAGYRILSLAHLYPGPFATMMLADLGADVIIVEGPQSGDRTRRFPGHFEALNRNKQSIVCELRDEDQLDALRELIHERADVQAIEDGVLVPEVVDHACGPTRDVPIGDNARL